MNLYIYSDESGVFDKTHNKFFVFGGIVLLGTGEKEVCSRKYSAAESVLRKNGNYAQDQELKATFISNKEKNKLFRSLNNYHKFAAIISQELVFDSIFQNKKSKQRFLDYAYKIALKRTLQDLIKNNILSAESVENIYIYVDEHTTATDGKYELRESLEQEFKFGTYSKNFSAFYPPLFKNAKSVNVCFCNSKSKLLVRSADIVANKIYYLTVTKQREKLNQISNMHITYLPIEKKLIKFKNYK